MKFDIFANLIFLQIYLDLKLESYFPLDETNKGSGLNSMKKCLEKVLKNL